MKYFLIYYNVVFPASIKWNKEEEQFKVEIYKTINSCYEWKCKCFPSKNEILNNLKEQISKNFTIGNDKEEVKNFMMKNTNYGINNIVEITNEEYTEFIK
jgi:hypothetical protein